MWRCVWSVYSGRAARPYADFLHSETVHSASSSTGASTPTGLRPRLRSRPSSNAAPRRASPPIASYRGFAVTVRPATSVTLRLAVRCPERGDALEYATARTLDEAQAPAYCIGLFQRLDHLLDAAAAELKAAQDGLA